MAKDSKRAAGTSKAEKTGQVVPGLLAEENEFDRRTLWRIGGWGVAAVGAVVLAVLANQFSLSRRREQVATADFAHQALRLQAIARENETKTRELATEIETLDSDRDRLFARVTVLEQGLDSVTGTIDRQHSAASRPAATPPARQTAKVSPPSPDTQRRPQTEATASPPAPAPVKTMAAVSTKPQPARVAKPAPVVAAAKAPVSVTESVTLDPHARAAAPQRATPPIASKFIATRPMTAEREPAALKPLPLVQAPARVAVATPLPRVAPQALASISHPPPEKPEVERTEKTSRERPETDASTVAVKHTDFAVDLGGARSVDGLRALWRGLSHGDAELARLRPIIVIRESHGRRGMQLHLAAGPLKDAATAAKICAGLTEHGRRCGTTVFDGQRLVMKAEEGRPLSAEKPRALRRPVVYRRNVTVRVKDPPAPPAPPPAPPKPPSLFSALFGKH